MKTEKKPNEPSCCPPTTVVKDESDADPVKNKDEGTGSNNDDTTGEDTADCSRDPCLDSSNGESTMSVENQSTNGNQPILSSLKQEGDPNNPTDELPGNVDLFLSFYNLRIFIRTNAYLLFPFCLCYLILD